MSQWDIVQLGKVAKVVSGSTPKTSIPEYWNGNYKWVTPAELKDTTVFVSDTERKITEAAVKATALKPMPIGTVLLSSRAPIGKVAIAGTELFCNQGFKNLICSDSLYNKYLFWYLKGKTEFLNSLGRGATFKEISKSIVESIEIPLPELSVQKQIAQNLDLVSKILSLRKQQLAELDRLIKSVFYEMFGDPIANEKGWEYKNLGDLATRIGDGLHGTPVYVNGGEYSFINGNNLRDGKIIVNNNTKKVSDEVYEKHKKELGSNTILISINGTLGNAAFYNDEKILLGKSACYINLKSSINKDYIYVLLKSDYFIRYAFSVATGTTIKNVSLKSMREFPIPYPPIHLQETYIHFYNKIQGQKELIQQSINEAQHLFNSLMSQYFD